jgi:putative tryptophan/tyrosine transport system substrate-binding protein
LEGAFEAMSREQTQALVVMTDAMFFGNRARIAELATGAGVPTVATLAEHAMAGTLVAYGPNLADMFRRATVYIDKILRGAKPADLPIEQPTKFDLTINLKTAKALGLTVPPSLLARANEVIE